MTQLVALEQSAAPRIELIGVWTYELLFPLLPFVSLVETIEILLALELLEELQGNDHCKEEQEEQDHGRDPETGLVLHLVPLLKAADARHFWLPYLRLLELVDLDPLGLESSLFHGVGVLLEPHFELLQVTLPLLVQSLSVVLELELLDHRFNLTVLVVVQHEQADVSFVDRFNRLSHEQILRLSQLENEVAV